MPPITRLSSTRFLPRVSLDRCGACGRWHPATIERVLKSTAAIFPQLVEDASRQKSRRAASSREAA